MNFFRLLSFIAISIFLGACISAAPRAMSGGDSTDKKLSWLGKIWVEGSILYASGISGECLDSQQARQQSYADALRKIAEYAGITVSNNSIVFLNSYQSSVGDRTNMNVEEIALSKAAIREFEYGKNKSGKYIGYVLVEYNLNLLDEEKKRKEKLEIEIAKKKKEEAENRRKIGILTIKTPASLHLIVSDLKQFLQGEGYLIGDNGKPINIILVYEEYTERKAGGYIATIKTEMNLNGRIIVSRSSGIGSNKQIAFNEAARQWFSYFKDDYLSAAEK